MFAGEVLSRLLRHVSEDDMATAAIVTLDLRSGDLRYASAGHPPPLVLQDGARDVAQLDRASAPPAASPGAAAPGGDVPAPAPEGNAPPTDAPAAGADASG